MYSLPSQIRDTEVTETEWSNPLGTTSKAAGFGRENKDNHKRFRNAKSYVQERLYQHLRKHREERALK